MIIAPTYQRKQLRQPSQMSCPEEMLQLLNVFMKKVKTHYLVKTKAAKRNTGRLGSFSKLENWEPGMQKA